MSSRLAHAFCYGLRQGFGSAGSLIARIADVEHILEGHALGRKHPQAAVAHPFVGIDRAGSGVPAVQVKFTPQIVSLSM